MCFWWLLCECGFIMCLPVWLVCVYERKSLFCGFEMRSSRDRGQCLVRGGEKCDEGSQREGEADAEY